MVHARTMDPDEAAWIRPYFPATVSQPQTLAEGGVFNQVAHAPSENGWRTVRARHGDKDAGKQTDMSLLRGDAVHALLDDRPQAAWLPALYDRREVGGATVWMYSYSGHPPEQDNAVETSQATVGLAEFLADMRNVPAEELLPVQAETIAWMRDPHRQPRPLPCERGEPLTADLARRALLRWGFEGMDVEPIVELFARWGMPNPRDLWREIAEHVPRGEPSSQGGTYVHHDLKWGNCLLAGAFVYPIDFDMSYFSQASPTEAATVDPIRFAHLTDSNPLLVPESVWRPALEPFAQRIPAFRAAFDDPRWADKEIGNEARHSVAQSLFDVREALLGRVDPEVGARSLVRFRKVFGYSDSDPERVVRDVREARARHGRSLRGDPAWRVPWEDRAAGRNPKNLLRKSLRSWDRRPTADRVVVMKLAAKGFSSETAAVIALAALKKHKDLTEHPSGISPAVLHESLAVYVAKSGFPHSALFDQDWLLRVADLNRRTMQSLLAGVSDPDSGVRLAEPETWTRAPGMPIQAQNYITEVLADHAQKAERDASTTTREKTPEPANDPQRPVPATTRTLPPPATAPYTAGLPTLGTVASSAANRRTMADPRLTGGCAWTPPASRTFTREPEPGSTTRLF